MKADIVIRGCIILAMTEAEDVIWRGLIALKDGKIIYVGREAEAPTFEADRVIDGEGKIALPGLINCHTHAAMALFRGIAEDKELDAWLRETIWPLEAKLKPQDIYYGTLLGCIEMIKSGTTCFSDMYFHENMVAKAVIETGLRCVLSPGIIEAGRKILGRILLRGAVNIIKEYGKLADGRLSVMFGPHTVYTCSPQLLKRIGEESVKFNVGVHIHLAETESGTATIRKLYGKSEVELLGELGLLSPRLLAAHCVHLSDADINLMAKHDVKVSYNPTSNMKLASGISRIKDLLDAGITVGLGTDGPASNNSLDMFETMKIAALLQKVKYGDPRVMPAKKIVEMATIEGARALGLDGLIGSLEVGKRADLILVDVKRPHLTPLHNPYAALVYSARGSDVSTVIVDGRIIMDEGEIKIVDEHEIISKSERISLDLLRR